MGQEQKVKPCPSCGTSDAHKLSFTWWGGALGPRLLNHVECNECGTTYNSKTGQSNTVNIVIYSAVLFVLVFVVFGILFNGGLF